MDDIKKWDKLMSPKSLTTKDPYKMRQWIRLPSQGSERRHPQDVPVPRHDVDWLDILNLGALGKKISLGWGTLLQEMSQLGLVKSENMLGPLCGLWKMTSE